ncbi:MAG TPA: peptidylprolyl isomerase [Stellaceae bacterium]|jgi:peptidyl-prolyl cis-trans isomerase SurA|nr:peptidylprolyl isomerase [Stellaceae bacterium]
MSALRQLCCVALAFALVTIGSRAAVPATRQAAADLPRHAVPAPPSAGPTEMRIAAVVNNGVISMFDLVSRVRMVMISSNIPDTPENRKRLSPQVLRQLIDEKLEMEEAKRQNVRATDDEIRSALHQIEKQNNMQEGQLNQFLQARGLDRTALVDQLTASIVWAKLVRRMASQTIEISDDEIDAAMKQLKEHANDPQSRVAEIFLSVDNPAQDAEVKQLADRLSQQMRQGARFSAVARQFSQSASAAVGGDLGWLRPNQLPPALGKVVAGLKPGELSPPIRAAGGYYLMLVLERRSGSGDAPGETYDIVQVVFPLPPSANEAARSAILREIETVRAGAKDCPSMLAIGKQKAPQLSSEGKLKASQISPKMRSLIDSLPIGQPSQPIVQKNGVGVIMVCGKAKADGKATREQVTESLLKQRFDTVARRYLEDLRRAAYVDVRV